MITGVTIGLYKKAREENTPPRNQYFNLWDFDLNTYIHRSPVKGNNIKFSVLAAKGALTGNKSIAVTRKIVIKPTFLPNNFLAISPKSMVVPRINKPESILGDTTPPLSNICPNA